MCKRGPSLTFSLAIVLVALSSAATWAADIKKGASAVVKADSIWFVDAAKLGEWQRMKAGGDAAAFTTFQNKVLGEREAWQFNNPLEVRVLGYAPDTRQVIVEMKMPGRMEGTPWFLDAEALE